MASELTQLISDLKSEEDLLECWRRLEEHFHSIGLKMASELTQLISDLKSEEAFEQWFAAFFTHQHFFYLPTFFYLPARYYLPHHTGFTPSQSSLLERTKRFTLDWKNRKLHMEIWLLVTQKAKLYTNRRNEQRSHFSPIKFEWRLDLFCDSHSWFCFIEGKPSSTRRDRTVCPTELRVVSKIFKNSILFKIGEKTIPLFREFSS